MRKPNLDNISLEKICNELRNKNIKALDLADWAIDNHEKYGSHLNAYKTWDEEKLKTQAIAADAVFNAGIDLGPLQGIPISIKDLFGVSNYPTYAGCPRQLPIKWQTQGPVVNSIRNQMAVISGKSHTVQFAFGGMGFNQHWGAPRNPWDSSDHRSPGGSSSGAGVSLGERSAMLAIGSDTAGSVRIPASMTGNVGMRPTAGRWSTKGIVPLSSPLDTAGPLTRTVADLAITFSSIDPLIHEQSLSFISRLRSASLSDFNIGVCDWYFDDCEPGISEGVKKAIDELATQGLRISSINLPHLDEVTTMFSKGGLHIGEFTNFMNTEMSDFRKDLDPTVAIRIQEAENFPASEHINRIKEVERMSTEANAAFGGFHAIVGPTLPMTPPKMSDILDPEVHLKANFFCVRNTNTVSLLKLCAITIPVSLDNSNMPVGLQIICPSGKEEIAIAIALAFEETLGTSRQRIGIPPMCASN